MELTRLRRSPLLIPRFIEEMLRYDGPSQALPRITSAEATIRSVTIPAGSLVLALVASANRDEQVYPDPDRFDIDRGSQGGIQFGRGIHFCIGAALARMEVRIALEALLEHFQAIERIPGDIVYNRALPVRGPIALPLRFVAA
jgi:cytochrome P450